MGKRLVQLQFEKATELLIIFILDFSYTNSYTYTSFYTRIELWPERRREKEPNKERIRERERKTQREGQRERKRASQSYIRLMENAQSDLKEKQFKNSSKQFETVRKKLVWGVR
jgi:hypothetical protein